MNLDNRQLILAGAALMLVGMVVAGFSILGERKRRQQLKARLNALGGVEEEKPQEMRMSCTRFLWTPICPGRDRKDDVQHEAERRPFGR